MNRWLLPVLTVCATVSACGGKETPAKSPAPAAVANPVTEAHLTSITLTPEAVTRLGIQTETTAVETVTRTRSIGGEIMAPPGGAVIVSAPTAGTLQAATALRAGTRVSRGQVIFTLYAIQPPDRNLDVEASRDVATAEAELVLTTQRAERLERLLTDGAVSARSVEEARAQQKVAAANAAAARSRAREIGGSPTGTGTGIPVRAPISGMVQSVTVAPGQTVAASAPLFEVVQTDGLWVRVPLFVGDRNAVDTSNPVAIEGLGGATTAALRATPVAGPATSDPLAATSDLFYALQPGESSVRPGDRVSVRLPMTGAEQALVVPTAGVVYDLNGGSWIYEATGPNTFMRRRIEIRSQSGAKTLVARGIDAGKRVVTAGAAELFGTEFGAGK